MTRRYNGTRRASRRTPKVRTMAGQGKSGDRAVCGYTSDKGVADEGISDEREPDGSVGAPRRSIGDAALDKRVEEESSLDRKEDCRSVEHRHLARGLAPEDEAHPQPQKGQHSSDHPIPGSARTKKRNEGEQGDRTAD